MAARCQVTELNVTTRKHFMSGLLRVSRAHGFGHCESFVTVLFGIIVFPGGARGSRKPQKGVHDSLVSLGILR
jgi:hypothetical protein